MTDIHVTRYGVIHYYAQCEQCDWDAAIYSGGLKTPEHVRAAVRRHVRLTGHSVTIESCKDTRYSASHPASYVAGASPLDSLE